MPDAGAAADSSAAGFRARLRGGPCPGSLAAGRFAVRRAAGADGAGSDAAGTAADAALAAGALGAFLGRPGARFGACACRVYAQVIDRNNCIGASACLKAPCLGIQARAILTQARKNVNLFY